MKSILSNDGIFQVAKNMAKGGLYHFKSYNNDNNSTEPKRRPHLLIDNTYAFSHNYKFLAITSSYNKGTSIPIVSNTNSRLSFVSLSSIIEMGRQYLDGCSNEYGVIYFDNEFTDMCKYIYLYKQLNIPIEKKYVVYLDNYLKEYNRMVDEDKFLYDNGTVPKIYIEDIINFDTIKYCNIENTSNTIIDKNLFCIKYDIKETIIENDNSDDTIDESNFDKDLLFIRDCLDPEHENDKILDAFSKFKEGKYDYKSLASESGIDYRRVYYYTRFINNYPAIERSIKYRNKINNEDINTIDNPEVENTLEGCQYRVKNHRKRRRRKRK